MEHETWERCGAWAGFEVSPHQVVLLEQYREWLITEAVAAGGIGPNESDRVDTRHIGDSLAFAGGFSSPPEEILDVGTGVGLPGIPLAVVLPKTRFWLIDRSGRRIDLLRRVLRILRLDNVVVEQGDIKDWDREMTGIVARGSLSADTAVTGFGRILKPGGTAVIGGSWERKPAVAGLVPMEVPPNVLDQKVWLLIMRRQ